MAISVDTVYQRVLAFANKEQRGYITPQEFNLFANQAQMEILNQYFYDVSQFGVRPGNSTEYSDMLSLLQEKLSGLEVRLTNVGVLAGGIYNHRLLTDLYKLGTLTTSGDMGIEIEQVNNNEWYHMRSGPLTKPTKARPVFVNRIDGLTIYPSSITNVDISYTRTPDDVAWGYFVINEKALYNANDSVDFELHSSEETELVYKILKFAGISMARIDLMRAGQVQQQAQQQQEKQ